jgi:hypothetical protein
VVTECRSSCANRASALFQYLSLFLQRAVPSPELVQLLALIRRTAVTTDAGVTISLGDPGTDHRPSRFELTRQAGSSSACSGESDDLLPQFHRVGGSGSRHVSVSFRDSDMSSKSGHRHDGNMHHDTDSDLAERFSISRTTAFRWIESLQERGREPFPDQSRRPRNCRRQTEERIHDALVELRHARSSRGPGKLLDALRRRHSGWELPSCSTAAQILEKHGLVRVRCSAALGT